MNRLRFCAYGITAILVFVIFTSCGSTKKVCYFQDIESVANAFYQDHTNPESRIIPNNNLF
ncbi:MAG: hypothetical protein LBH19_12785, partial [Dysgonamonadaceae bacterium]|nr:hypothetical protein [Dysgonamonadaceae bacterium]